MCVCGGGPLTSFVPLSFFLLTLPSFFLSNFKFIINAIMSCGINKENQELKEKHWKAVRIDPVLVKIDIYLKVKMAGCFQSRTQLLTGL